MFSNTALISQGIEVDTFYQTLLKQGGIVQKYEENVSFITAIVEIQLDGVMKILGTYEKVSSGFINICYTFPQKKIENKYLA